MKLLFDTNAIIDFLKQKDAQFDLSSMLIEHECFTSIIVKLELLKSPTISMEEEQKINDFLKLVPVISLNDAIAKETISLSRHTKLKLPDAIIGATAIIYQAEIVTGDLHFLKCEKLHIWNKQPIE